MMGSKRRASRDMARMDGKHFSLDSVLTVLSFLILVVVVVIPMVMIVTTRSSMRANSIPACSPRSF